tara:strand:+ start:1300 stop:1602 length:303 start_codon:yes stop_codon:yes gene_type:complete
MNKKISRETVLALSVFDEKYQNIDKDMIKELSNPKDLIARMKLLDGNIVNGYMDIFYLYFPKITNEYSRNYIKNVKWKRKNQNIMIVDAFELIVNHNLKL